MTTKKRAMALLVALALGLLVLAFLFNNVSWPSRASRADFAERLERARGASRDWALGRDAAPLEEVQARWSELRNPALLHMLVDAAEMAGEDNVKQFAIAIQSTDREGWWSRMVDPRFAAPPPAALVGLEEYQRWFLHALGCDQLPMPPEAQRRLLLPDAYRTGRLTHQFLALYLYGRYCAYGPIADQARALMPHLAERIAQEAALDFRLTDLYLQRIVCLLLAGRTDLVRTRWVERVLDAQQVDGGWKYNWYGWDSRIFRFHFAQQPTSAHATAQGLWLISLIKYRHPEWIAQHYR